MKPEPIVDVAADSEALAQGVADWIIERVNSSRGAFALSLSGGSTPRRLYALLASPACRNRIPWQRIHLFWGDERFVPPDHPDSNYGMAHAALISHVPVPEQQIHRIPTAPSPEEAACAYEHTLQDFYTSERGASAPLFDVMLLGLGPDGHTASLFPGNAALDERKAWVVPVIDAKPETRITLTYPAIASSRAVAFIVAGAEKHSILERLRHGDQALPAARVKSAGEMHWFLDRAAASGKEE